MSKDRPGAWDGCRLLTCRSTMSKDGPRVGSLVLQKAVGY